VEELMFYKDLFAIYSLSVMSKDAYSFKKLSYRLSS
jgi:hypothetical protein